MDTVTLIAAAFDSSTAATFMRDIDASVHVHIRHWAAVTPGDLVQSNEDVIQTLLKAETKTMSREFPEMEEAKSGFLTRIGDAYHFKLEFYGNLNINLMLLAYLNELGIQYILMDEHGGVIKSNYAQ